MNLERKLSLSLFTGVRLELFFSWNDIFAIYSESVNIDYDYYSLNLTRHTNLTIEWKCLCSPNACFAHKMLTEVCSECFLLSVVLRRYKLQATLMIAQCTGCPSVSVCLSASTCLFASRRYISKSSKSINTKFEGQLHAHKWISWVVHSRITN